MSTDQPESAEQGVTVPEEFQKKVHELVKGANKHHLNHMSDRINERRDELHKESMKGKKSITSPEMYSTEDMPQSD